MPPISQYTVEAAALIPVIRVSLSRRGYRLHLLDMPAAKLSEPGLNRCPARRKLCPSRPRSGER